MRSNAVFILVVNTCHLFTLAKIFEGVWESAQPVFMCFMDLEKAHDHVLTVSCGRCSENMGHWSFCYRPFGASVKVQ